MHKILKSLYILVVAVILILVANYKIRITDDIYRHIKMLEKIDIKKNIYENTTYFYRNYGNIIFYNFLFFIKKTKISIKSLQYLTIIFYYILGYLNLKNQELKEKQEILLLIIIFVTLNPFYIATLVHFPLAIIFIMLGIYLNYKNHKKLEIISMSLAYLTHTGSVYIIIIYFFSKLKITPKLVFNKKLAIGLIIFILIFKGYIIESGVNYIKINLNNVYLNNKIDSYFFKNSQSALYGGMGKGSLVSIFYFTIISFFSYFKIKKNNQIITFYYLLLFCSLILSTFNMIFLVRSMFLLILIYPQIYKGSTNKKLQGFLIFLGLIFIIEYRFLLNLSS